MSQEYTPELTIYDEKSYFEEVCRPLMTDLEVKCQKHGIPLFISAAVANTEDDTEYIFGGAFTEAVTASPVEYRMVVDKNGMMAVEKESYYKKECVAIARQLISACTQHAIPIFISAVVYNKDGNTVYQNQAFMTGSSGIHLYDDRFRYYLEIAGGGFKAVPKSFVQVMDMSSFGSLFHDVMEADEDDD